jgi:hypothetical protein
MKIRFVSVLSLTAIFFLLNSASGQKPIVVSESQPTFSHGVYPGLKLRIPEVDQTIIENDWINRIEKKTKSEVTKENGELTLFGALIEEISELPLNIFSKVTTADSAVVLEITVELRPREYVSSSQSLAEFQLVKKFLFEFGRQQYADLANEQLKVEEKNLSLVEEQLESLYSDKTKLEKSIGDSKSTIAQNEDEVIQLKTDLVRQKELLSAEKSALGALTNEESIKLKEDEIRSIEKSIEKANNEINDKEHENVDKKAAIESANSEIDSNLREQEKVKSQYEAQRKIVELAEKKFNTITNSTLPE